MPTEDPIVYIEYTMSISGSLAVRARYNAAEVCIITLNISKKNSVGL
jgi:hypothetical protein